MRKTKKQNIGYRPTWVEVNLNNLAFNFRQIRKTVPRATKVMVCVKADAYGHGLVPVSRTLVDCGVDYLGVASIDEAIRLRDAGIRVPILVLGVVLKEDIAPLFAYDITPTVCSLDIARALNRRALRTKSAISVHIKVDTGMGRVGVLGEQAPDFIHAVSRLRGIRIEGLFTHLACTDTDKKFTGRQIAIFNGLQARLAASGVRIPLIHAANSLGTINYPESHFTMVRPGLAVYGLYPQYPLAVSLKPVLSLKTRVVYCKDVPKGFSVSYGRTYVTKRRTTIVTLPIGYGDGYPRNLSNKAPVVINGSRFSIAGRVCMDQIMVDVGDYNVRVGDQAVLIGAQGKKVITTEELAALSDTISYEIVCGLGSRVPRIYTGGRSL
jgi:alanine racemase